MAVATGVFHRSYRSEFALRSTRIEWVRLALIGATLLSAPFVLSPKWLTVADQIGIAVIGAVGLNLLVGFTGQISIGHGGFLAVGAYSSGLLITRFGAPTTLAVIFAVAFTALVGAFFGLPALRLKGLYLAIATLASQFIIIWTVRNWDFVTGGVESMVVPAPAFLGFELQGDFRWYWIIMSLAVLSVLAATNLVRTGLGRALVAIRDDDIAAEVIGVNTWRYKLTAFAISSGFVGLAGALLGSWRSIVTWERFTLEVSVLYLAIVIVGGLGSVSGTVYGAIFMLVLPTLIDDFGQSVRESVPVIARELPAIQQGIFGLVIVLFLIFEPHGLARIWQRGKNALRNWPFRY